jgi:hypothetical protein
VLFIYLFLFHIFLRIKDHEFASKKITFTLPRPLTVTNVAVRILFTKFDVYSPRSKTFSCRIKREKFEFDPIPELIIEKEEVLPTEGTDALDIPPELRAIMELADSSKKV